MGIGLIIHISTSTVLNCGMEHAPTSRKLVVTKIYLLLNELVDWQAFT